MKVALKDGERIDDLERNGLKIIQNKNGFCFGMDAVLLSGFVKPAERGSILDLGTGTGIIPILLSAKLGASDPGIEKKGAKQAEDSRNPENGSQDFSGKVGNTKNGLQDTYGKMETAENLNNEDDKKNDSAGNSVVLTGLEIQETSYDMAVRSVQTNGLEHKIRIVKGDIKEASEIFGRASFNVVTSNPPYIKANSGIVNPVSVKAIARHEISCTFDDLAEQTSRLLKPGGRFYLVHRPQRLAEIICTLKKYGLEPKRLKMVHSFTDSEATLFLMESVLGGNPELRVEKPLIIYKEPNVYTDEIYDIYGY